MGRLTQEQQTKAKNAETLYLNGYFRKAYTEFKSLIEEIGLLASNATEDQEGLLSSTIRVIKKLESIPLSQDHAKSKKTRVNETPEAFRDKILVKIIQTPGMFSQNIVDRSLLLEYKPEEFSKLYYTSLSTDNQLAYKVIVTINYDAYFKDPTPKRSYDIFSAKTIFHPEFFNFSALISLDEASLSRVYADFEHYGLSSQALQTCNSWGDSLAHRSIWWGGDRGTDKALTHLRYSAKFSNNFLAKYLHQLKNHQGENWLDDVARHTHEDSLVCEFIKFLDHKKLQHFSLLKKGRQEYLKIAIEAENSEFVQGILESVKRQSDKIGIEQRIFNLNAFSLSKTYSTGKSVIMDLMRKMGTFEYQEDLDNYERNFAQDPQNVHRAKFAEPLVVAIKKLEGHYNSNHTAEFIEAQCQSFQTFFYSIISQVGSEGIVDFLTRQRCSIDQTKLVEEFLGRAEFTLSRILNIYQATPYNPELFKAAKEFGYPQTKEVYENTGLTLRHALAYVWAGLSDINALSAVLSETDILERRLLLVLTLYQTYIDGIEDAEQVTLGEDEDVVMQEAELLTSAKDTTERLSHEKVKGVICMTGLFDRIVSILDKQHDMVDIQISTSQAIKITEQSVADATKLIGDNLLEKVESSLLFARLCDNFELFISKDLSKKFVPLLQHGIGVLKEIFFSTLEMGYLGDARNITEAEKREVFIIFENVIKKLQLSSLTKLALDKIKDQNISTMQSYGLCLKIFLDRINSLDSEIQNYKILFSILLIDKVRDEYASTNSERGTDKVLEAALYMSSPLTEETLVQFQTMPAFTQFSGMMQHIISEFGSSIPEKKTLTEKVSQTIRALAAKQEWDGYDIVKFQIITSKNPIFKQENIIVDLFKHAILQSNLQMLKAVINKAEYLYEGDLAIDDTIRPTSQYNNKYLEKVAEKDFADGMNILHLTAKHCTSESLIELLLNYHEFREKLDVPDKRGCTPFYIAAFNQNLAAMKKFIEYGADINIIDDAGTAPIHLLASHGRLDLVGEMIKFGANPFPSDSLRSTFIHRTALFEEDRPSHMDYASFEANIINIVPISEEILPYCSNFILEILGDTE